MLILVCDQCKAIVTEAWRIRVRPKPGHHGEFDFCSPECVVRWFDTDTEQESAG